jgi:PAS domain S-box-containing protein
MERSFFETGNPLKKLMKIALDLFDAEQVGVLYGTNASKTKFLPTSEWDRGIADMFDGRGVKGTILKYFGRRIVSIKKLSPVYFYKQNDQGQTIDNDGIISYMLRTCADYYKKGISVIFSPDVSADITGAAEDQYAAIPFYSYNGQLLSEPDIQVKVDLNIIKHFSAQNYISIYIPDFGILVVNTADPDLMARKNGLFLKKDSLITAFDQLIRLVEVASLAALGQLKGKRGAHLLWKKETLLRQTSQALIENERKYRDLYENAPIAYFSVDSQGTILKVNQTTSTLSGYEKDDLVGHNIMEFHVPEKGAEWTVKQLKPLLEKTPSVKDLEIKFRSKKNKDVWVSLCVDTVKDQHNQMVEIRAMAVDISERKTLEKQLLQSQKMEAIGTLASGIAHDFNNILTPVSGYSEMLLLNADQFDEKARVHLKIINDCALYAKGLVDKMLTFSRQKESEFKVLYPHVFVEDALSLAKSFMPATIKLETHINQSCDPLMVDPVQAHQMVMNLISNAYYAMEKEGGVLTVILDQTDIKEKESLMPLAPGAYMHLKIQDTGPGIPTELLDRVFDPFFTTKKEGKGSGIGLSVVHGIVQSHKGHISVQSEPGKGSVFNIYLPFYSGKASMDEPAETEPEILTGTERILLVDDDQKVAFMVQYMLENLGYQVTSFINSPDALDAFKAAPASFDLVVTDLTMPELTGYQLSEQMHAIRPDMPIVLCTGFGEHIDKKNLHLKGIQGILNKPLTVKAVSHLIRNILDGQGA